MYKDSPIIVRIDSEGTGKAGAQYIPMESTSFHNMPTMDDLLSPELVSEIDLSIEVKKLTEKIESDERAKNDISQNELSIKLKSLHNVVDGMLSNLCSVSKTEGFLKSYLDRIELIKKYSLDRDHPDCEFKCPVHCFCGVKYSAPPGPKGSTNGKGRKRQCSSDNVEAKNSGDDNKKTEPKKSAKGANKKESSQSIDKKEDNDAVKKLKKS